MSLRFETFYLSPCSEIYFDLRLCLIIYRAIYLNITGDLSGLLNLLFLDKVLGFRWCLSDCARKGLIIINSNDKGLTFKHKFRVDIQSSSFLVDLSLFLFSPLVARTLTTVDGKGVAPTECLILSQHFVSVSLSSAYDSNKAFFF